MSSDEHDIAAKYLQMPWDALRAEERRVLSAVMERRHVSRPPRQELDERTTPADHAADRIAAFGGSWPFIGIFFAVLFVWMALNVSAVLGRFDPYPFILLNLMLSCLAAVQAPVILMSQNRQAAKDRAQAAHDYEVNLKAELEILRLHAKIDALAAQELSRIIELQERQIRMLEALNTKRQAPL
jgi:uncharacterized membrane protein